MFSAYDLKKIIPRAIFALVAINLSWSVMEIMINAMGEIGEIAQSLVTGPFGNNIGLNLNLQGGQGAFTALAGAAAIAGVAGGLLPIAGVAMAAIGGIFFAFVITMIRRVMLIALVIIAPVAIGLSVFPQTEKWAKEWFEWFTKLLLMYPFIMAMFGLSEVAAYLISSTVAPSGTLGGGIQNILFQVAGMAVLIAPYFLVGKSLSFAGKTMGRVAGFVNNRDKGLIDRTKKWEGAKVAERRTDAKAGARYGGRNTVTRGLNRTLRAGANPRSVVGSEESRDLRVLSAIQRNAATMEGRHEAAKTLTKDELALVAAGSDKSQIGRYIESKALEKGAVGTNAYNEEKAKLVATARSATGKVGGSLDAGSQLYALQKGVADGSIDGAAASAAVDNLTTKLATSSGQSARIGTALAKELDSAAKGSGSTAYGDSVSTGGAAAPIAAIDEVFSGPNALSLDKLGGLKGSEVLQIASSKSNRASLGLHQLATAAPADIDGLINDVVGHRADLEVARQASAAANNTQANQAYTQQLENIETMIDTQQTAGIISPAQAADIRARATAQAKNRTAPIP